MCRSTTTNVWAGTGDTVLGVIAFIAGLMIAVPFALMLAAPFMTGL